MSYQDQFFDPALGKRFSLLYKIFHRNRLVRAPNERDGAIGASPVASFRDFEVGICLRVSPETAVAGLRTASKSFDKWFLVPGPKPAVNLRNKVRQLGHVSLGQTAEHDEFPHFSGFLPVGGLEDGLDGLLLGVAYESAGVHKQDIDRLRTALRNQVIHTVKTGEQTLRVDGVLRTSQRYDLQ